MKKLLRSALSGGLVCMAMSCAHNPNVKVETGKYNPDWKVEKWDPDALVKFYKSVGARYFFKK